MKLMPVKPTGTRRAAAFVDGPKVHTVRVMDVPVYPPSPEGKRLRQARMKANITMGELARKLSIGVADLSELELGELTTDAAGLAEAMAAVESKERDG